MNQISHPVEPVTAWYVAPAHRIAQSYRKRAFDVLLVVVGLLVFAPVLLAVAVAILIEGGGPILFKQLRTGLGGKSFTIYKFRTMRPHDCRGTIKQATVGDERVTLVGKVIRPLSIDELPQLLNVLRGDMSLVGPRPHAISHDLDWSRVVPSYPLRFRARPGLTGLAQVSGYRGEVHAISDIEARVEADNAYIDNWSLLQDFQIALRTIPLMVSDRHAH